MPLLNENYQNLEESYLFAEIARRVSKYEEAHPDQKIIRLGIGDVTKPLTKKVIEALHKAVEEQAVSETFRGYGPEKGYDFLRNAISAYYKKNGADVDPDTIFISDGAKSDTGNITDLFGKDNVVLVPDPVYPVYVDTNLMDGRKIVYMNGTAENDFLPMPDPSVKADLIYLCSPNNPTGACYSKEQLEKWVAYAKEMQAVILFDAAYEAFVSDPALPRSIFEIEGAKECAIEFCSLSKTAGFTGTRCSYTVIPKELVFPASNGAELSLHAMWNRRHSTKFNGTPYIVQRAAEAVFSPEGQAQIREVIAGYQQNAQVILKALQSAGLTAFGGVNAPYIWLKTPQGVDSWAFFDQLLTRAQVVGTPGVGFGSCGEGYFRLTAFNTPQLTQEAARRLAEMTF